ncbi:MAG TPA: hypothetical protein VJR05_03875 [Acidimicrobiia bacterium]|nr:hypothetical protein [Acidimicrobiia bacterium]
MRRIAMLALAVTALTMVLIAPAAASGGKPIFRETFDDRFVEDPDLFVLDVCGVEVVTEFHIRGTFTLFEDLSATNQFNFQAVSFDPSTGDVLLAERDAGMTFSDPVIETIDEEAGTLTIMFSDTVKGNPLKWVIPGEGVIILDAGQVTISGTVVFDLATGEVLFADVQISNVKGPHPFIDLTEEETLAMFCGAMGG